MAQERGQVRAHPQEKLCNCSCGVQGGGLPQTHACVAGAPLHAGVAGAWRAGSRQDRLWRSWVQMPLSFIGYVTWGDFLKRHPTFCICTVEEPQQQPAPLCSIVSGTAHGWGCSSAAEQWLGTRGRGFYSNTGEKQNKMSVGRGSCHTVRLSLAFLC